MSFRFWLRVFFRESGISTNPGPSTVVVPFFAGVFHKLFGISYLSCVLCFVIFLELLRLGPLRSTKYQIVCLSSVGFGIRAFGFWELVSRCML